MCTVKDIIEELLDLDREPKPESLWWTSTCQAEENTPKVGTGGFTWDLPFKEVFEVLGYRFHRGGKWSQAADRTLCKGIGGEMDTSTDQRAYPLTRIVEEFSATFTALPKTAASTGRGVSLCWPRYAHGSLKIMRLTFRPEMYAGTGREQRGSMRIKWGKVGLPTMTEK